MTKDCFEPSVVQISANRCNGSRKMQSRHKIVWYMSRPSIRSAIVRSRVSRRRHLQISAFSILILLIGCFWFLFHRLNFEIAYFRIIFLRWLTDRVSFEAWLTVNKLTVWYEASIPWNSARYAKILHHFSKKSPWDLKVKESEIKLVFCNCMERSAV